MKEIERTAEQIRKKWDKMARELPKEKREQFMECIKKGETIGTAMRRTGVHSLDVAMGILNINIGKKEYFKFKSKTE